MNNMPTIEKLKKLRLNKMAERYEEQLSDPNCSLRNFEERFEDIVSYEWNIRENRKFTRLLKKSNLKYPQASFDESIYQSDRLLNVKDIEALSTLTFMEEGKNVLITGTTGTGKSYLSNAFCISALNKFKSTYYCSASYLIRYMEKADINKTYDEELERLSTYDLLCIDDFGLMDLDIQKCKVIFEILEARNPKRSTIVVSQLPVSSWYELFGDKTYADACMDRLTQQAYRIEMNGVNMRERQGRTK